MQRIFASLWRLALPPRPPRSPSLPLCLHAALSPSLPLVHACAQVANLKASLIRITRFLENDELPEHIRQRSINAGKQADASQHGRNAANAEVCAVSTVSAVSAAGADAYASKMGASEVVSPTPSFDVACASAGDSGDLADIAIRGTFAWPKPEVPVGKGKGKGKGKGGGGGKDGKGDAGGRGGRGGRGRGGGSDEVTVEQIRRGMFRRKPLKAEPTVSNIAEMKEVEAVMSTDTPPSAPTSPEVKPTEGGGSFNRGRGRGRAARKSKEPPPKEPLRPTLHELDVTFPHGQLTMVAGAVGSGKSSLLCALLGELQPAAELPASPPAGKGELDTVEVKEAAAVPAAKPQGEVRLEGQAGYFAQTAFILNDTVRGNILLGAPMDDAFYQRVLAACALLPDLEILPGGDLTQIGEKGINLSGGQKARIALARACYARARTILLDDPLSAVDAHVGKHIFREVFGPGGLLAGCTRILVTHQTQFLPCADKIVILHEGKVLAQGTYKELRTADVDLSSIASLSEGAEADMNSILGGDDADADAEKTKAADKADQAGTNKGTVLINEEERASGSVSWAIHLAYLKEMGGIGFGIILLLACFFERAMMVLTDYWLAMWIDPSSSALGTQTPDRNRLDFWIPIYFGGVLVAGAAVFSRSLFMGLCMVSDSSPNPLIHESTNPRGGCCPRPSFSSHITTHNRPPTSPYMSQGLRAARAIYAKLAAAVLDAPMIFFETTPSGRILNRFTSDTEMMDFGLLMQVRHLPRSPQISPYPPPFHGRSSPPFISRVCVILSSLYRSSVHVHHSPLIVCTLSFLVAALSMDQLHLLCRRRPRPHLCCQPVVSLRAALLCYHLHRRLLHLVLGHARPAASRGSLPLANLHPILRDPQRPLDHPCLRRDGSLRGPVDCPRHVQHKVLLQPGMQPPHASPCLPTSPAFNGLLSPSPLPCPPRTSPPRGSPSVSTCARRSSRR